MFHFHELTENQQTHEVEAQIEAETSDIFWAESVTENVKEAMGLLGIDEADVDSWDAAMGFAAVSGYVSWEAGVQKRVRAEFPLWTELHELADGLMLIQRPHFYRLNFGIQSNGARSTSSFIENAETGEEPYHEDTWESDRFANLEADIDSWITDLTNLVGGCYRRAYEDIPEMAEYYLRHDADAMFMDQGLEDYDVDERITPDTKVLMVPSDWGLEDTPSGMTMRQWVLHSMQPGEARSMLHMQPSTEVDVVIDDPLKEVVYIPVYLNGMITYNIDGMPEIDGKAAGGAALLQGHAYYHRLQEVRHEYI